MNAMFDRTAPLLLLAGAIFAVAAGTMSLKKSLRPAPPAGIFPHVSVTSLDGAQIAFDGHGQGSAIITVFATWCTPCKQEMPEIAAASAQPRNSGIRFIEIDASEQPAAVAKFMTGYPLFHGAVYVTDRDSAHDMHVFEMPHTMLVRPDGRIVERRRGIMTATDLRRLVFMAQH